MTYLILYLYASSYYHGGPAVQLIPMPSIAVCEDVGRQVKARLETQPNAWNGVAFWCIEGRGRP